MSANSIAATPCCFFHNGGSTKRVYERNRRKLSDRRVSLGSLHFKDAVSIVISTA